MPTVTPKKTKTARCIGCGREYPENELYYSIMQKGKIREGACLSCWNKEADRLWRSIPTIGEEFDR